MNSMGTMSMRQLLIAGGPLMIPLIICSMAMVAIILEKLFYLSNIKTNIAKLKLTVFDLIRDNKIKEVVELCNSNPSPVAKVLKAGGLHFGASREEMREAIENVSLIEIPMLERRLNALATIANTSPLLGLLGTVIGLTTCFQSIQFRNATLNPVTSADLAGGIWQALLTTAAGLLVAIPAFIAYNYLVSRVNAIILEMERAATELINFLNHISESKL